MLPAVEHHAARAQVAVCGGQSIEAVGRTIASLIALGNKSTTQRREVRAILIRHTSVGTAHMRTPRATTVAYRCRKENILTLEIPHNETSSP